MRNYLEDFRVGSGGAEGRNETKVQWRGRGGRRRILSTGRTGGRCAWAFRGRSVRTGHVMSWQILMALAVMTLLLFAVLLAGVEVGYRVGRKRIDRNPDIVAGAGVIEASIFGLMGLLLAFQFSAAQTRLEFRRGLIVKEANAIGTAYLRLDLLPASAQGPLRELFRRYIETRIAVFESLPDVRRSDERLAEANGLQGQIWAGAITAVEGDSTPGTRQLVIPALNDMIDITTERAVATRNHVPAAIIGLLLLVALAGAVLAGHAMAVRRRGRSTVHQVIFAAVIATTLYVMVDLEFPRYGLVHNVDADRAMYDTRAGMK